MDDLTNANQTFAAASRPAPVEAATALPQAGKAEARAAASPGQVLAIVCVGIVLANLDLFIVNVALPDIARDFGNASLDDLSWVLNGYAIAYAALLVFFGRLAERHRRDRSFLLGVALFTIASGACAVAGSVAMLVTFRIAQAAGAALMTPTSIGLLLASFPPDRRAGAVRNWAAIGGLAAALAPLVGGVLVTISWRWIFIVNVPVGLIAILVGWWKLPAVPGHDAPRPNPVAALLVTGGIAALTFAIVKGNDWGWTAPGIVWSAALSAACLAAFIGHCLRSDNPFIPPSLFGVRAFSGAALVMAPYSMAFGATLFSAAVWGQTAWGWSALKAGLVLAPGPFLVPVTSLLFASRLIARFGAAAVVTAGIAAFTAGLAVWATFVGPEPDVAVMMAGIMLTGIGVGLTFPTLMGIGTAALPPSSFATGSGVINMIRQAGLAIGVALFIAVVAAPGSAATLVSAYRRGWWAMAAVTAVALIPTLWLIRPAAQVRPQRRR
ncbi:MAG: MFS transporter [Acetobacteraceae bacterium]|nr:MFS transporter [Pseudomonadota bacterium]